MEVHVVPNNDFIEHEADDYCLCGPTPQFVSGGTVMLHHSLDDRERSEDR